VGTRTILSVVGARPQFVKAAVVGRALARVGGVRHVVVHTGQHHDPQMSDVFFEELEMPAPDHHLGISGDSHGVMTGRMLVALDPVLAAEGPDLVVVLGDTNSTLAGALVAAKQQIPIAHVEAGLRSFDRRMPEETNRVVADHLSDLLLCPTRAAVENLAEEGIARGVHHVGDVMYDATLRASVPAGDGPAVPADLELSGPFVVLTLHRAENTADRARLELLLDYVRTEADGRAVVFPVHPRTKRAVEDLDVSLDGFRTCRPLGYLAMAGILRAAEAVFTDSGGIQKEAYFHRVPCVTLRESTEWVETIDAGWNRLWRGPAYAVPRRDIDDYGSGDAGDRIAALLCSRLG
jgi:UDP-GlcNAc3NAcA epimerase